MHSTAVRQCYFLNDLESVSRPRKELQQQPLLYLPAGDNQNACCCGGSAVENSCSTATDPLKGVVPPQLSQSIGGIDSLTKLRLNKYEEAEARKIRLTGGARCKTLLDDAVAEPLPPTLRRPGESKHRQRRKPKPKEPTVSLPFRDSKYHEELEKYLNHLPFFGKGRYDRVAILKRISRIKPLRGMLKNGRYFIEKDWINYLDPRMDPDTLLTLEKVDERKKRKYRANGPVYRIVELFMDKVFSWSFSREMIEKNTAAREANLALLWLGPSLARKMLIELCVLNNPNKSHELKKARSVDEDFYLINRLAIDVFFSDKEAFYYMLKDYILSPSLVCKARISDIGHGGDVARETCPELETNGLVTRRVCVHQNLSLSLKPCMVPNCTNFKRPVCEHLYAFIPETITINSYISMLHFVERFQRVEDLKGCIFITKPAYLCNGRGINFLTEKRQFEYFYHMHDGRATSRHGVILQRYIECPRLFDKSKFTIRFFLLIVVLPKRRVIGFIHYGVAIFSLWPYRLVVREEFSPEEEELEGKVPNMSVPIACRTIGRVETKHFSRKVHITNYRESKVREKIKEDLRTGKAEMMDPFEDNVFYLEDVLPAKCMNSTSIYIQMLFAAQCIMDYMQPVVQDYPGTFQTVSIDSLVDARNKLWVLEAGTKIFSGLLTVAPRQRQIMSSIIQESLGITIECFYKSFMGLPLYWDYHKKCENYDAFYFGQDFNFFYETDITRQTGYADQRTLPSEVALPKKLLEQRYLEVDTMRDRAKARKLENAQHKQNVIYERRRYVAKVKEKHEEES